MRYFILFVAVFTWFPIAAEGMPISTIVRVDARRLGQKLDGFGGNLTESSAMNILRLPRPARQSLLQRLFSPTRGYGLAVLRLPIGSSDFNDPTLGDFTYDDTPGNVPDPELKHFDASRDEKTFELLREILAINPKVKLVLTPWSAPPWMKANKRMVGDENNTLLPEYYDAFARYLVRTVEEYRRRGLHVHAITLQNEPGYGEAPYPSMRLTPEAQAEVIGKHLGWRLRKASPGTGVWALDHNWDYEGDVDFLLGQKDVRRYLTGVAYHCYGGHIDAVGRTVAKHGIPVHLTECTSLLNEEKDREPHEEILDYRWWVTKYVIRGSRLGTSSAMAWNLALDEVGGPQNNGCPFCRGMITIHRSTGAVTENEELRAFGLVSRHAQPGARLAETTSNDSEIHHVAFRNRNGSLAVVLFNDGAQEKRVLLRDERGRTRTERVVPGEAIAFAW